MDRILDDDMQRLLDNLPNSKQAIDELFERAKRKSEGRYYVAILDLQFTVHCDAETGRDTVYRHMPFFRPMAVQQFSEYLSALRLVGLEEFERPEQLNLMRRLHMLAYSQFWECLGVQRILLSLTRIALGHRYDPVILLDQNPPRTSANWKDLMKLWLDGSFPLHDMVKSIYHRGIRNSFAHSDFFVLDEWVLFDDPESKKFSETPSLKTTTWDRLYRETVSFIEALFSRRRAAEAKLKQLMPFPVSLPEFQAPFKLYKDQLGNWTTRPM